MAGQIWLVEDDDDDIEFYRDCLAKLTPQDDILSFNTAENVLKHLEVKGVVLPHLIIVDGHLPGMGGPELINRLLTHPYVDQCRVVMITGTLPEKEIAKVEKLGVRVYTKPDTISRLFEMLQAITLVKFSDRDNFI